LFDVMLAALVNRLQPARIDAGDMVRPAVDLVHHDGQILA
jgi:hypothetical protein